MPIFFDFQSAITDELLEESAPLDSEAAVFFGKILASRSKGLESETYFRLAAEAGNPKGAVELGMNLQRRGKSLEAITWLRQSEVSDSCATRLLLARALSATGSRQEAEEVLDTALAAVNANYYLHHLYSSFAWEYFHAGFIQKAIQCFELAYRRSEGTGQYIAWLHILAGEEDKAMRWINDTREKGLVIFADMLEGDHYLANGKYKEAIRSYSKATSLKTKDELLTDFDILLGLRIATTYKAWGNSKELDRWTSEEAGCVHAAGQAVFDLDWSTAVWNLNKLMVDDASKRLTDLNLGPESTNAMCNWGISYFRFGNLESAIVKLESALNAPDGTSESEASFFLMHAYAELGRIEDSAEMKRRCDAAGGYEPQKIDRKRLGME
jgi:tetratricopeptide (TPR) repeat protein